MSLAPNYPNIDNPQGKVYIYSYKKITGVKQIKKIFQMNLIYTKTIPTHSILQQLSVISYQ